MKRLIIISLLLSSCYSSKSQRPAPGTNVINNYINKFEGTWRWMQGNDTLIIKLKKINTQISDYTEDVLMAVYKYVQNGIVIENTLNFYDSLILNEKKRMALIYQNPGMDTSNVMGSIKDRPKKKLHNIFLQFVNGTPPTITWHLEIAEGVHMDPNFQYGMTLPQDIILTKQ